MERVDDPEELARLRAENAGLRDEVERLRAGVGAFSPGHFHSPLPDLAEVQRDAARLFEDRPRDLPGLDRNEAHQLRRLHEMLTFAGGARFPVDREDGWRYYSRNDMFPEADAFVYSALLRLLRPRQVIEVGSGYSSAVLLDTLERHLGWSARCTFVEPDPTRLRALLREDDWSRIEHDPRRVQDVPLSVFDELGSGDILFIDSSHVAKVGSDVNHLVLDVLPRLASGVEVHLHDILANFEYPRAWVEEGRAWNEAYLVRAFLLFNPDFEIDFHGPYMAERHMALCHACLPHCDSGSGSSLWLRRR